MKLLAAARSISSSLILLLIFAGLQACGGSGGDGAASNPPVFTSGAAISVAENATATGYTVAATDADGDIVIFSLSGGVDLATFSIDTNSGVLSFNTAPDFEAPTDNDTNNTYVVEITATDGANTVAQSVTVTVTDVFDVSVSTADIKTIQFDWYAYAGATSYKLFVNPDGASGFSELQGNITGTSTTIELPVHLTDWTNASYILEAHDGAVKLTESSAVSITALMISSIAYVKASNAGAGDTFGYAVSLSADGNTLAVGAYDESSSATGIGGDQVDNTATSSGAVYVFSRNGSTWIQQAYIKASNTEANDWFGRAVSLSADGNTLAVGAIREDSNATGISTNGTGEADNTASDSGAVYVFSRSGTAWSQQAYIKASNTEVSDQFGYVVSMSGDGDTLAVGAQFEDSIATGISTDGTGEGDNLAGGSGAVYVFSRSINTWSQQAYIKASNTTGGDTFGSAASLSADGNTLAVGAYQEDSSAVNIDGNQADSTGVDSGAVYVFSRSGSAWSQQAYVKASNTGWYDFFGHAVSLSADGSVLAVGAFSQDSSASSGGDSGAVYIFNRSGSAWSPQAYVKASNTGAGDWFGITVSLSADGNTLAVGASREDSSATGIDGNQADNTFTNSGAVYVYSRSVGIWGQQAYVKASNMGAVDQFGIAVSLSADGNTLAVGVNGEDSNATGIGGNQADNTATDSGAVYLY